MMAWLQVVLTLSTSLLLFAPAIGSADSKSQASSDWNRVVDEFFNQYFTLNPTQGTSAGFHQYDSDLEDYSRKGIDNQIAFAKDYLRRLETVASSLLPFEERHDYRLVTDNLKSTLLELQDIRGWEKNPDRYSSGLTQSAFVIMSRKFAPPEKRLRSLIDRERAMPGVLLAARENLKNPPRIYTEVAIQQLPGVVGFFQKDVPEAFNDVKDQRLLSDFRSSNLAVIAALEDYEKFLKETLLPRSRGDFRIGAENYRKKLWYDEMVDIPEDRSLQIGYDDLRQNQQWFKKVAGQLDPKKTPDQIRAELQQDHPAPDQLLDTSAAIWLAFGNTSWTSKLLPFHRQSCPSSRRLLLLPGRSPSLRWTPRSV